MAIGFMAVSNQDVRCAHCQQSDRESLYRHLKANEVSVLIADRY